MKLTAANYITIAVLLGGLIGNWYLMQDHVSELQDDMDALMAGYQEFRIYDAKREAREESADELLVRDLEHLSESVSRLNVLLMRGK